MRGASSNLLSFQRDVVDCTRCPRLVEHCRHIGEVKRRAYRDWDYWARPVPSFGDPRARLLIVGLAPGAHGANRTGRMFTGDSSGDFLYRALHETGFGSQPESVSRDDGLRLSDAWITAAVHCAPPQNKPAQEEFLRCSSHLDRELLYFPHVLVVVTLGRLAHGAYLGALRRTGEIERKSAYPFEHGREAQLPSGVTLLSSYHPSRQNTQTGRLTADMLRRVFNRAQALLAHTP